MLTFRKAVSSRRYEIKTFSLSLRISFSGVIPKATFLTSDNNKNLVIGKRGLGKSKMTRFN